APVLKALTQAVDQGVRVIGICNGFQVLTECGLLPGALQRNSGLHFICDTPPIEVVQVQSVFSSRYQLGELIRLPIAHGEGNYTCDELTLRHLQAENRIVFRYASGSNPNGSLDNIAGILNPRGNVLGMMPHPERAMADWMGTSDGRRLFESVLNLYPETADAA
ncbi:MAG: phosphoribosylformylglycinamidine synthase I, partial [SAR324 cluster bacterium]|nr:phosphoribosylformylglycinamidine synthase I [SAR324 cluster bacterium]